MNQALAYFTKRVIAGLLVIIPIYLAILVLLKGMKSLGQLVRPFTKLLPEWLPAEQLLSLILVLVICFLIGVALRTRLGEIARKRVETGVFERIPGYGLFRSLTQQIAGDSRQTVWKPALVEIEDALVPAFIIEVFDDGRYTIFVPLGPHPPGRRDLHPGAESRASPRRVLHRYIQSHLQMGCGRQGPGSSHGKCW